MYPWAGFTIHSLYFQPIFCDTQGAKENHTRQCVESDSSVISIGSLVSPNDLNVYRKAMDTSILGDETAQVSQGPQVNPAQGYKGLVSSQRPWVQSWFLKQRQILRICSNGSRISLRWGTNPPGECQHIKIELHEIESIWTRGHIPCNPLRSANDLV